MNGEGIFVQNFFNIIFHEKLDAILPQEKEVQFKSVNEQLTVFCFSLVSVIRDLHAFTHHFTLFFPVSVVGSWVRKDPLFFN